MDVMDRMDVKEGLFVQSVHKVHAVHHVHSYILPPFFSQKRGKDEKGFGSKGVGWYIRNLHLRTATNESD